MIAEKSLDDSDVDVVKQTSPEGSSVKRPATTTPMTEEEIAILEEHLAKWSFSGRSHFFGVMWRKFVEQSKAGDDFDWPPRFLTKKEAFLLKEILPLFSRKEILLLKKMVLADLKKEPAKKKPLGGEAAT